MSMTWIMKIFSFQTLKLNYCWHFCICYNRITYLPVRWGQLWLPRRVKYWPDVALWSPECRGEGLLGPGHWEPDPGQPAAVWEQQKQGKSQKKALKSFLAHNIQFTVKDKLQHVAVGFHWNIQTHSCYRNEKKWNLPVLEHRNSTLPLKKEKSKIQNG